MAYTHSNVLNYTEDFYTAQYYIDFVDWLFKEHLDYLHIHKEMEKFDEDYFSKQDIIKNN